MIRTTTNVIAIVKYLSQHANTCLKSATETLAITKDDPNENIFGSKQM